MSSIDNLMGLGLNKNEAKLLCPDHSRTIWGIGCSQALGHAPEKSVRIVGKTRKAWNGRDTAGTAHTLQSDGSKSDNQQPLEDYSKEATEALGVLEKIQEDAKEEGEYSIMNASAWMVRSELGVKRRLAELIYSAKEDIFAIGGYPPKYLLAVKTALKAATKRGVKIWPISMIRPSEDAKVSSDDSSVFEFRTVKASTQEKCLFS
jgi:hypothetical protein